MKFKNMPKRQKSQLRKKLSLKSKVEWQKCKILMIIANFMVNLWTVFQKNKQSGKKRRTKKKKKDEKYKSKETFMISMSRKCIGLKFQRKRSQNQKL